MLSFQAILPTSKYGVGNRDKAYLQETTDINDW